MLLEGAGLGTLGALLPGCTSPVAAAAASTPASASPPGPPSPAPIMADYTPAPLPFDPKRLPGLSETLLRSHHENNYVGAVKKLNAARTRIAALDPEGPGFVLHGLAQGELAFKHSVVLHEAYFGNLTGGGSQGTKTQAMLADHFGGATAWEERFRAFGRSLGGGSGWAILEYDLHQRVPRIYSAGDHTQGLSTGVPLLVLDMYEHSYHMDYGTKAARYIDAFFANLHWEEVDRRTEAALEVAKVWG